MIGSPFFDDSRFVGVYCFAAWLQNQYILGFLAEQRHLFEGALWAGRPCARVTGWHSRGSRLLGVHSLLPPWHAQLLSQAGRARLTQEDLHADG